MQTAFEYSEYKCKWGNVYCLYSKMVFQIKGLYSRCKFPFKWNGVTHNGCAFTDTPSLNNKECKDFQKSQGQIEYENNYDGIVIAGEKSNNTCYGDAPGDYGWYQFRCLTKGTMVYK